MTDFVHLHNHSEYSLLDGLSKLAEMVERAAELQQPAIALTDHGNIHGAIDFYQAASKAGIKPIIGVEGYVAPGPRAERNSQERFPYHITLLAQNLAGYQNILKLVTAAHLEGFYYRPRFDREILEKHSEGIIVLSGCPSGELARNIKTGQPQQAEETLTWYQEVFEDRYYLELMMHQGVPEQEQINRALVDLSKSSGVPLVVTNDSHYVRREDAPVQDILTCIVTNSHVNDPKRLRMEGDTYYLRSGDEMAGQWAELPDAIRNTMVIAESCELKLDFGQTLVPRFQTPGGASSMEYLRELCTVGLRKRYENPGPEANARLEYELEVIEKTRFADYFLVCWDIFNFVNKRGILSAVRGSAAASLVLYCLEITQVDPLLNGLIFERFLNVERREMPDIDMDFADDRREEVIRYCVERYGREHVAQIITFGTLGARASVRDTARALGMEIGVGDRIARLIPTRLNITIEAALRESSELRELERKDQDVRKVIQIAKGVEGSIRHASTHAAGVVISEKPLTNYVALQRSTSGDENAPPTTQFAMKPLADVGLLKMDFLGLTNLTILDKTASHIARNQGEKLGIYDIPLDDAKTYELLSRADTFGVFQMESPGMRRHVKELKPTSIADVAAMIALYRPGPMEEIETFIAAKHGRAEIQYPHDDLKHILEESYGVIVYQDQVMLIAQHFGGYTLGEADVLRKAMGKKIPAVMKAEREKFITGAVNKGYTREEADKVFRLMEPFAGYGFNKSHAISYAMIAYWTAYFKANHPVEYLAAYMDSFAGNSEKIAECIREARRVNVEVLRPDINRSSTGFAIEHVPDREGGIRFGMSAVKNVGEAAITPIIAERDASGAFKSLEDFCRRVDARSVNRRALESLIKVGTFDGFGPRGALLESTDRIIATIQRQTRLRESGQTSMFDMFGESVPAPMAEIEIPDGDDTTDNERVAWERELLGIELTETALTRHILSVQESHTVFAANITAERAGETIHAVGQVGTKRELTTRRGDTFLSLEFRFLDGAAEMVVWPNVLETTSGLWTEGEYLAVKGEVRERAGRVSISVTEARPFTIGAQAAAPRGPAPELPVTGPAEPDPPQNPGNGHVTRTETALVTPPGPPHNSANGDHDTLDTTTTESTAGHSGGRGEEREPAPSGSTGDDHAIREGDTVVVRVEDTGKVSEDRYRLEDIVRLLLEYPGGSDVTLEVTTGNRVVRLDMGFARVDAGPDLEQRLSDLVGRENVSMPVTAN